MKNSQWIGIVAAIILIIACFLPWTFHPDLQKTFTGFFSENNVYGKPGKVFIVLSATTILFFLIPRIWAKRWNLFICSLILAFAIKSFILFTGCYRGICPDKKEGIWIMLFSSVIIMLAAVVPDIAIGGKKDSTPDEA